MRDESVVGQRRLVSQRLHLADAEFHAKYAIPFIDKDWMAPFTVLDLMGAGPRVFVGTIEVKPDGLHATGTSADLRLLESVPLDTFGGLAHYDPWWVFRGVSGVPRDWIDTVIATNIAHPFVRDGKEYKVHDLEFSAGLRGLTAVIAKDEVFNRISFHREEIDLLSLRRLPRR